MGSQGLRETERSQPLGHIAEVGTEIKHGSSSKQIYNLAFCVLIKLSPWRRPNTHSLLCKVAPSGFLPRSSGRGFLTEGQVPPIVQWEGLLDRGADYLSPQHYIVFRSKLCARRPLLTPCCLFLRSGRITAGLTLRIQAVITQNYSLLTL